MINYKQILEAINRGIKFALDDFDDNEQIQGQTNSKVKYQGGTKEWLDLMNNFVDLQLPSGTLWAKYNLGVDDSNLEYPSDWYGNYYAWGETDIKDTTEYTKNQYKFAKNFSSQMLKYNDIDQLTQLELADDAAYQLTKYNVFNCRIPTVEQFEELLENTTQEWVSHYKNIPGLFGKLFTGNNGNILFFPACGSICSSNNQDGSSKGGVKNYGYYWTSQKDENEKINIKAKAVRFHEIFRSLIENNARFNGFSIKPVLMNK